MRYSLSDEQLLHKLDKSIRECKISQMYLNDVFDDYGKIKVAKLRFEFARTEYFELLKEVKSRNLMVAEDDRGIAKLLFN
ncbi:MAG: DUF2508 family protein [Clostridia bacterium]